MDVHCTSDLIKTCAEDFRDYNFEVIPERPPTSLKSGSIDVITAKSVFSHFSCGQNVRWIQEFSRLVKSRGYSFSPPKVRDISIAFETRISPNSLQAILGSARISKRCGALERNL